MTNRFIRFMVLAAMVALAACSSTPEDEGDVLDEVVNASADEGDDAGFGDEGIDDEIDEFGSDEIAQDDSTSESFSDDQASADDAFGEEGAGEEEFGEDEQFDENQFADESFDEDPAAAEEFTEELIGDSSQPLEPAADTASTTIDNRVTAINYLSSANGGTIEIRTDMPATYKTRMNEENNQFVIELEGTLLPESLKRPYIMKDFEGQFGAINAYQNAGASTARVVVELRSPGEPVVTQEETTLLVVPAGGTPVPVTQASAAEEAPPPPAQDTDADSYNVAAAASSEKVLGARNLEEFLSGSERFFGRPISLQTNDADIRDVINFISEESGLNLVISEAVKGRISVKLRQVPWDQALVIVMKSNSLGYTRQGNVVRITTLRELEDESAAAKRIVDTQKNLVPLKVKVIPVSYANVTELTNQLKPFLTTGRGQIVHDERTTSLIITDTVDVLERLERLVKELDIPPAQVMIEGKIVEASESFTRSIGINFLNDEVPTQISSSGGLNNSPITLTPTFRSQPITAEQLSTAVGSLNVRVGVMDFFGTLDATLGLAQADQLVRIISSPRVVTMNKNSAQIEQRGQVVSVTTTVDREGNLARTVTRNDVVLNLTVVPQVTAEGSVVLEVKVRREFPGAIVDQETLARPINSRSAETKILIPNGQTGVLGGIYQSDETESESGIPGLKDIPVLGWLFKTKVSEKTKNELLIFLTPRILNAKEQTGEV